MAPNHLSDDRELVLAAGRGDTRAWNAIVHRHGQMVWSIGRRCGLGPDDADDLVQAVFSILVRGLGTLQDPSKLGGWLAVTARREAWRLSERARRHEGLTLEEGLHPAASIESDLESEERRQAVREALARLGDRCRDLLMDLFSRSETPSYEEVARRLGLSPNSVGPTRRRCLEDLLQGLRTSAAHLFDASS